MCTIKLNSMEITAKDYNRILRLDPTFFDLKLGRWYKGNYGVDGVLVFFDSLDKSGNIKAYGFNGGWIDNRKSLYNYGKLDDTQDWIEATDEEVGQALISEAKLRGFKQGCTWGAYKALAGETFYYENNYLSLQSGTVFSHGDWREVNKESQLDLQIEIARKTSINIVTCGNCGSTILHRQSDETITCPDCGHKGEPCDFPDLNY